ncbi:ABC transporter ATP-binding protein [Vallitalea guaymasensis]|uniref:ABC transporter ATP-binding protein n=1 Tax=Vallitalea guaymasensis TaxID=1185412 RepID=A0A8J8MB72_9FIRM|nr:ABC transporter ATP-binding protein [Vallitalea guaymasensis]QUH29761.1 ABC transporter ATP-binding protein [Vallitalea guaymasensis]
MKKRWILGRLIKYCFNNNGFAMGSMILASILLGILSVLQIWIVGQIVNGLGSLSGQRKELILYMIMLLVCLLLWKICFILIPYVRNNLVSKMKIRMQKDLIESVNKIPVIQQEINETQMKIGRAFDFINNHFETSLISIQVYISSIISVVSISILLARYSWVFPVIATLTAIPIIFIRLKQDKKMHEMYKKQYPNNQLADYYLGTLTKKDSLLELMVFQLRSHFLSRYLKLTKDNVQERTRYFVRHSCRGGLLEAIWLTAGNVLSIGWAIILLSQTSRFSLGVLAIVIRGITTAQDDIIGFAFNSKNIYQATFYGEDFWEMIYKRKSEVPRYKYSKVKSIELRHVGFRYPHQQENSLSDINLILHTDETMGIVGENGSGKSTISKILLGIYQPTEGEILVNGHKIENLNLLYEDVGAVFQDYVNYQLTPRENIRFGSLKDKERKKAIIAAARKSGAHTFVKDLKKQYDTPIGTLLDNATHLSGGQWQRLAVARGFYSKGSMIVLDEPNSNLDPKMEAALYEEYKNIMNEKNRIGILVSHRLGSTRACDRIIVMNQGRIVEDGSFEQLMNAHGKYSHMYQVQAEWYTE